MRPNKKPPDSAQLLNNIRHCRPQRDESEAQSGAQRRAEELPAGDGNAVSRDVEAQSGAQRRAEELPAESGNAEHSIL